MDVVDIARFAAQLERTPGLVTRVFTPAERGLAAESLAARFAAKEAVAKALGAPVGLRWHDVTIRRGDDGRPHLEIVGSVAERAAEMGIDSFHISLSHDAGVAGAVVIAERLSPC
jgi:holo-[acyl-carrier protein] synthase